MNSTDFKTLIRHATSYLPKELRSREAWAMMHAIALQHGSATYRRKDAGEINGYWQFARYDIAEVMGHQATRDIAADVLTRMDYEHDISVVHEAVTFDSVLGAIFARLLLYTHKSELPLPSEITDAFNYYNDLWNPSDPRVDKWSANYAIGWNTFLV